MPTSRHRKSHKVKAAKRRQEHELKRHRTAQLGAKLNTLIQAYKVQEAQEQAQPFTTSLPATEIFPNINSII